MPNTEKTIKTLVHFNIDLPIKADLSQDEIMDYFRTLMYEDIKDYLNEDSLVLIN